MALQRNQKSKRRRRRWFFATLIALVMLVLLRNPIAGLALVHLAPAAVGVELKVDGVRIGWTTIEIFGVRIEEPQTAGLPQLETEYVQIVPTLEDGFRHGIWARRVAVERPTLHLRFDEMGSLISKFPEGGSEGQSVGVIPIRELLVRDASLVVHQHGRQPFSVTGMKLVGQFAETIRLRGELPQVFGGSIVLQTELEAKTLAGRSKVTIENVEFESAQIEALPLLPESIRKLGISANLVATAEMEHPLNPTDFLQYNAMLTGELTNVCSTKYGPIVDRLTWSAANASGRVRIAAQGTPFSGSFDAELLANLNNAAISTDATLTIQDCDLRTIADVFAPDLAFSATTNAIASAHVSYADQIIEFKSQLNANAKGISLQEIPADDVLLDISATGTAPVFDLASLKGTINGSVRGNGVAIADVAKRFELPAATGRVAASAEFSIPLSQITEPEFYSLKANVQTNGVSIAGHTLSDSTVNLQLENAVASVGINNATVLDQQSRQVLNLSAAAEASLGSGGVIGTAVDIAFSPSPELISFLGLSELDSAGHFRLTGSARSKFDRMFETDAWSVSTTIQSRNLAVAGESIGDFDTRCEISNGKLAIPRFEIPWRNNRCVIAATGHVGNHISIDGTVETGPIQIEEIAQFVSRFSNQRLPAAGIANVDGCIQARVPHWRWDQADMRVIGEIEISEAHFGATKIGQLDLTWTANRNGLTFMSDSNDFFGGHYAVAATIQDLDWTKTIVNGQFHGVQATRLASLSPIRIPATGVFDGGLQITEIGSLESATGSAWISSRGVTANRIPLEISTGLVAIESGKVVFNSEGMISRGRYAANAHSDLLSLVAFINSDQLRFEKIPVIGKLEMVDCPVASLKGVLEFPKELNSLHGNLSAAINRDSPMLDGDKICDISCRLENLQLNQVRLSDRIVGELTLRHDQINLRRVDGRLADGRLSGRAELRLSANPTGTFELSAQRLSLRRLATAIVRDRSVSGSGTVSVRGKFGPVVSGRADVTVDHAVLAGVRVREAKFPVDWSYSQPSQVARWQCRAGMIALGGGKVRIGSVGTYGKGLSMATTARIERVDSSKLLAGKSFGAGTITGNVTVNAKRARSVKKFTGRFDFELAKPDILELPVLNQLPAMVSLTPPRPGSGEDGGHVEGRIAGGLVHIDQLAIVQNNVRVLMSGNATQEGRLNFDVIVSTESNGPIDQLLSLADSPLMLAAPAPVALVAKANDLMKDRVVNVHVGGMANRPTLQLQPGKQLSQNAVRFFLNNSLGSQAAEVASRRSQSSRR